MRAIKLWPENERPRERLLELGPATLSDAELLAIILRTGDAASGTTAIDQARALLNQFGSLTRLAAAQPRELQQQKGIGPAKSAEIMALGELAKRLAGVKLPVGKRYSSSKDVFGHFHFRLRDEKKEHFFALLLDAKNRLISEVLVSTGSLTASIVHPREVFAPVVREGAAGVLFVHNHPSGDPTPSREDLELTDRLRQAGALMGVRVLDHIIIGHHEYMSLADQGRL